jgi:superfamily II DNA or RNA helicase
MSDNESPLCTALAGALPVYEIPDDDLVGEVLTPAMAGATTARIAAGFFSSHCLAQVAPGLAAYIEATNKPVELMISPDISQADADAIERGAKTPNEVVAEVADKLLSNAHLSASAVVQHTLDCLAYLVAVGRLELRFVLMRAGMYHKKIWLFNDGSEWAAVHGSGNATTRGLLVNGEQMTVDRPWMDGPSAATRVELLIRQWDRQWNNEHPHSVTLEAPQGLKFVRPDDGRGKVPTVGDFWDAWRRDYEAGLEPELPPNLRAAPLHQLRIPDELEWREGPYAHQGVAVDAFLAADGRGVLEIATGGGKTRTALIAATQLQNSHHGPALIVILVPSKPLMLQWAADVQEFGLTPLLPSMWPGDQRRVRLEELRAALAGGPQRTEVIVATNQLFTSDQVVRGFVEQLPPDVMTMLIADEMHNLGVPTFLNDPPQAFEKRLGLSATPIRQYDPDGTDQLFDFFGQPVYEFSLADAIDSHCLTPYRYVLHEVHLSDDEMDKYKELTEELRKAGFRRDDDGRTIVSNPKVERLLRERRAVLENASAKVEALRGALISQGEHKISRTLIYTSAKPNLLGSERQIESVNRLLTELGVVAHQFTNAETSRADARAFLDRFGRGGYQVLTAMKVLDEGVDIPQTDTAYVLASSTVRREWIQRRGRILRQAEGKEVATLHDFLVIPPDPQSSEGKAVLRGELARAEEFADLAVNEWDSDGPREIISRYE